MPSSSFTFNRDGDTSNPLTIDFSVGGTATFLTDYTVSGATTFGATAGSVVIPSGQTSASIIVTPVADTVVESNESVILTVTDNPTVYNRLTTAPVVMTIQDDDDTYRLLVLGKSPTIYLRFEEAVGVATATATATDSSTNARNFTFNTTNQNLPSASGVFSGGGSASRQFNGSTWGQHSTAFALSGTTFAIELSFQTSSTTSSAKGMVGFTNTTNATGWSQADRSIWIDEIGRICLYVENGGYKELRTSSAYNDGNPHHLVAQCGAGGMQIYIDGVLAASRTDITTAPILFSGYWRIGGSVAAASSYFNGKLDEIAVYTSTLTGAEISARYADLLS
jgi:Concanavalin A-like lectin/glucanases superfamily